MKIIPAIDLKDNKCVRLTKGKEELLTVYNDDPIEQAKYFESVGIERIHIIDLDGAFGKKEINKNTIIKIQKSINIPIQLGGGIREVKDINFWLDNNIDYLIIGSFAIKNYNSLLDIINQNKNKIYIALDFLDEKIMIKGWKEDSLFKVKDIINIYNSSFIKGYILTDISRDGMLSGLDVDLFKLYLSLTKKSVVIGGGLSNNQDLFNLKKTNMSNLEGVIAGKSFYSGSIDIKEALKILNSNA